MTDKILAAPKTSWLIKLCAVVVLALFVWGILGCAFGMF